jgi:hypothetical protein
MRRLSRSMKCPNFAEKCEKAEPKSVLSAS